jgi:hypothetical protein
LISVSLGLLDPDAAPFEIPATAALLQLKVVPEVALVGVYEKTVLLQMAGGVSELVRVGLGFTGTVTFCELVQPFAVSVYT